VNTQSYTELWNLKEIVFNDEFYKGWFREDIKKDVIFTAIKSDIKPELIEKMNNFLINYQYLDFSKKFSTVNNQYSKWSYKNWEYVKTYKSLSIYQIKWDDNIIKKYNPIDIDYWSVLLHESIHLLLSDDIELKEKSMNLMIQVIRENKFISQCIKDKICNDLNTTNDKEKNDLILYHYYNNILNTYSWNNSWWFYRNVFSNSKLLEKDYMLLEELIAFSFQNKYNKEILLNTEYWKTLVELFFN